MIITRTLKCMRSKKKYSFIAKICFSMIYHFLISSCILFLFYVHWNPLKIYDWLISDNILPFLLLFICVILPLSFSNTNMYAHNLITRTNIIRNLYPNILVVIKVKTYLKIFIYSHKKQLIWLLHYFIVLIIFKARLRLHHCKTVNHFHSYLSL